MKDAVKKLLLFMPTVNQQQKKLLDKINEIQSLEILLARRGMGLRVLAADDGSEEKFQVPETLQIMKDELGPMFDFQLYKENMGKTVTVANGLEELMKGDDSESLIGCLDDNEHSFLSAFDLIRQIEKGYLGAIGTISYPSDILSHIDRHAMPAVGAIESQLMNLKGSLCIYASGYWINYVGIVRIAMKLYPMYRKLFREMFPNEIILIPGWGTPTLFQEFMNWTIKTQLPWSRVPEEYRRMAVCYLPCNEVPAETPLGRSMVRRLTSCEHLS
jgi:hypothetical protein